MHKSNPDGKWNVSFSIPLRQWQTRLFGRRKPLSSFSVFVPWSNTGCRYLQLLFIGPVLFLWRWHTFWCWFQSVIRQRAFLKFRHGSSLLQQISSKRLNGLDLHYKTQLILWERILKSQMLTNHFLVLNWLQTWLKTAQCLLSREGL